MLTKEHLYEFDELGYFIVDDAYHAVLPMVRAALFSDERIGLIPSTN